MPITVKFFASLREEHDIEAIDIDAPNQLTALQVWKQVTGQSALPAKILIAVNQEYANDSELINDGDEVAFFPPVTGG